MKKTLDRQMKHSEKLKYFKVYNSINENRSSLQQLLNQIQLKGAVYETNLTGESLEIINDHLMQCVNKISRCIIYNELQNQTEIVVGDESKVEEQDDQGQQRKIKTAQDLFQEKLKYRENFEKVQSDGFPFYKCKICQKFFQNNCACHNHWKMTHTQEKYPCFCGSSFYTIEDFYIHRYVIHSEKFRKKSENFECEFCSKIFSRKQPFIQHLNKQHMKDLYDQIAEFGKKKEFP